MKHIGTKITALGIFALMLLLAGGSQTVSAAPTYTSFFPTASTTDGKMLILDGFNLSTLQGLVTEIEFIAPPASASLDIGIFDGDTSSGAGVGGGRAARRALLPLDDDRLGVLGPDARHLVVAGGADQIVRLDRAVQLLPRVDEVRRRDGHFLAAVVPVRVGLDHVGDPVLVGLRGLRKVEEVLTLVVQVERAVNGLVRRDQASGELVAAVEVLVEPVDVLLLRPDGGELRLAGRHRPRRVRERLGDNEGAQKDYEQAVQLDLSAYAGMVPEEMFGRTSFPAVGELPYLLTLAPRGFFWFQLRRSER